MSFPFKLTRLLLFVMLIAMSASCATPPPPANIDGFWLGVLYQDTGGFSSDYPYAMNIIQPANSEQVTGVAYITVQNAGIFGELSFEGTYRNGQLQFTDIAVLRETLNLATAAWCMKTGTLTLTDDVLQGAWTAPECDPGTIELRRRYD
jgi:hypothetical protein